MTYLGGYQADRADRTQLPQVMLLAAGLFTICMIAAGSPSALTQTLLSHGDNESYVAMTAAVRALDFADLECGSGGHGLYRIRAGHDLPRVPTLGAVGSRLFHRCGFQMDRTQRFRRIRAPFARVTIWRFGRSTEFPLADGRDSRGIKRLREARGDITPPPDRNMGLARAWIAYRDHHSPLQRSDLGTLFSATGYCLS